MSVIDRNKAFDTWYVAFFGNVLGAQDADNRDAVRKIWNGILEHVAKQYEFQLFEEMTGDQIADQIRRLQAAQE